MFMNQKKLHLIPLRKRAARVVAYSIVSMFIIALAACSAISPEATPTEANTTQAVPADKGSGQEERAALGERSLPDRLQLPAIDADMPIVELGWHAASVNEDAIISEWDVAKYAAGWHKNSALPGELGNIVMSGHNNIYGSVFRELDLLRKGDDAIVWTDGEPRVYEVEQVLVVPEANAAPDQRIENAKWIGEFGEERLTLVSCWPRNNNTHRIIVVALPASDAKQAAASADAIGVAAP